MRVLVEFQQSRKIVSLSETCSSFNSETVRVLKESMGIEDYCAPSGHHFQYFDKEFETWVDLEEGHNLEEKTKIKITVRESFQFSFIPPDPINVSLPSTIASESSDDNFPDSISEVIALEHASESTMSPELKGQIQSQVCVDNDVGNDKTSKVKPVASTSSTEMQQSKADKDTLITKNYDIPSHKFSSSLHKALKIGKLDWANKHELLNILGDKLYSVDKYPTLKMRREMAQALVTAYPMIKERLGSGFDAWAEALQNKVKSIRAKDSSLKSLPKKTKNHPVQPGLQPAFKKPNKGEINWAPEVQETEDETSLEKHKLSLKKEFSKVNRDHELIKKLMDITFPQRRVLINSGPLISTVQDEFPALFSWEELNNEFFRLLGVDGLKIITEEFPAKALQLIQYAEQKLMKDADAERILNEYKSSSPEKCALMLLPLLLREKPDGFYRCFKDGDTGVGDIVSPVLVALDGENFSIAAEGQFILHDLPTLKALSSFIGLYYGANLEYPQQCNCTFTFFQKEILKINDKKKIPTKLVSFVGKLAAMSTKK